MSSTPILPHQTQELFLTDGGIETWLMYQRGIELQEFSAFHSFNDKQTALVIREYYRSFADVAKRLDLPFIFDSLTYRASHAWGDLLGYSEQDLAEINHRIFEMYRDVAKEAGLCSEKTVLGGCVGPKSDAYELDKSLTADGAEAYHTPQIETFKAAGAHYVTGLTLNTTSEAIGITRVAKAVGLPVMISFIPEKNRKLLSGETLREAIEKVDHATENGPAFYMINCSHPLDFGPALAPKPWADRIQGVRANASILDHGELCKLGHLEAGNPDELASQYCDLRAAHPKLNVFGGCCGTDFNHIEKIAIALLKQARL